MPRDCKSILIISVAKVTLTEANSYGAYFSGFSIYMHESMNILAAILIQDILIVLDVTSFLD